MASQKYLVHLDLSQNELQNATIQNLTGNPTNPAPLEGQIYFNSSSHLGYIYNGSSWVNIMSQGTTYTVGDNGLTRKNFTVALHDKLVALRTQTQITADIALKANIANPTFTGTVAIPSVSNVSTAIVANTAKVGITNAQASAISTNTGKVGITTGQASAITTNTNKNSYPSGDAAKVGRITVTQAVNLDTMEADIAALANGMVYKGDWDASAGTFPGGGSAQIGWFYYVSVSGTVNSVVFKAGDNIVAIKDNASTGTFANNWSQHDNTDAVTSVVGLVGSISKSALLSAINVANGATPDQDLSGLAPKANPTFSGTIATPNFSNLDTTLAGIATNASGISSNDTDIANANTAINLKAPKASPTFTGTVSGITKAMVGLGNVANETRATILGGNLTGTINSIAVATVTDGAAKGATSNQDSTATIRNGVTSTMVGLGNVPNLAFSGSNTGDETRSSINGLAITTVGTITSGTWNAGVIPTTKTAAKVTALVAGAGIDVNNSGVGSVTVTAETASVTNPGIVELATTDEALAGLDTSRAVTAAGIAARSYKEKVGNGSLTTIPVLHGLKTQDVIVQLYSASTYETVYAEVVRTTISKVDLKFNKAPATNSLVVLITKVD